MFMCCNTENPPLLLVSQFLSRDTTTLDIYNIISMAKRKNNNIVALYRTFLNNNSSVSQFNFFL